MNYMKFKDIANTSLGVYVTTPPNLPTPNERGEAITIPGRNGVIFKSDGAWDTIALTPVIWIPPTVSLQTVRLWLTGEGNLMFEAGASLYYKARVSGGVEYMPLQFDGGYQASIPFECFPFRYAASSPAQTITVSGGTITNPYGVFSEPRITVNGSGDSIITIGGTTFTLEGIVYGMILDTEIQEAYKGTMLYNYKMEGAFPTLQPGVNSVSWSGNISSIVIEPRWRTL